jgi:hypothetical protein
MGPGGGLETDYGNSNRKSLFLKPWVMLQGLPEYLEGRLAFTVLALLENFMACDT